MPEIARMPAFRLSILIAAAGLAVAVAQPITKTGECTGLTRYTAPSTDVWSQFPYKPNGFDVGTLQNPLAPQQSANCLVVPPGFKAELWASELNSGTLDPGIAYIQHFAFDERGRLWAVEPRSYPNTIRQASGTVDDDKFQGGKDRILILEDTDGDKVVDNIKVFKSGLNLPQGIEVVNGGVVVAMTPYLVFFPNVNDVAGPPQILFSGLGGSGNSWDTHGGISSLMYGLDNWIYGHTGYNWQAPNACSVNGVNCGQGRVWRFRHTALGHSETKFESWTTGPSNAWGIGQMEDGQIFQSGATGTPHINHSIRKGVAAIDIRSGTGTNLFYPITGDRYLWEGGTGKANGVFTSTTTAVSGMQFYTSRLFPQKYWNRFAFECEGASKLCNQDSLVPSGSTWKAMRLPMTSDPNTTRQPNLIASTDAWVAPILAKTGPDGAVWVLDWYNYLFLHNPATPGGNCQNGIPNNGCAWNNALREKSRVRIWRVLPTGATPEPVLNLATAAVPQLVEALGNPNMHWRLAAQRLLIQKGYSAEVGALLESILGTDRSVDAVGNNPRVVHALWTLQGMGQFASNAAKWNPILRGLLTHPAWGARRNVVMAMPRTEATATALDDSCTVNDPNAHVRLQALVAFSEISPKPSGLKAMQDAFRATDSYSQSAFAASGLASAAASCNGVVGIAREAPRREAAQPRSDLRLQVSRDGFRPLAHGQLPDGELIVTELNGRVAFRSAYKAREARWTNASARGMGSQVYLYTFRGADGSLIQGRLALAAGLR